MPATSKAQFRFMQGVKSGDIKAPGLSPAKAAEFVDGQDPSSLPARAGTRLGKRMLQNLLDSQKGKP